MTAMRNSLLRTSRAAVAATLLAGGALLAASAPQGTPSREVQRGEKLAQAQCSACHVVAQNQEYPPLLRVPAPSFQSIADRPGTNEKSLRHFVATTHWDLKSVPITMPSQELSKADTTAVVRYILSLQSH